MPALHCAAHERGTAGDEHRRGDDGQGEVLQDGGQRHGRLSVRVDRIRPIIESKKNDRARFWPLIRRSRSSAPSTRARRRRAPAPAPPSAPVRVGVRRRSARARARPRGIDASSAGTSASAMRWRSSSRNFSSTLTAFSALRTRVGRQVVEARARPRQRAGDVGERRAVAGNHERARPAWRSGRAWRAASAKPGFAVQLREDHAEAVFPQRVAGDQDALLRAVTAAANADRGRARPAPASAGRPAPARRRRAWSRRRRSARTAGRWRGS